MKKYKGNEIRRNIWKNMEECEGNMKNIKEICMKKYARDMKKYEKNLKKYEGNK